MKATPAPRPWPAAAPSAAASQSHPTSTHGWRQRWARWQRPLLGTFSVLLLGFVAWHLQSLDWAGAWQAVQRLPASTLAVAACVAAAGHINYAGFDLLARRWLGLALPAWRVAWGATVSYAFTLNLGSMIGGAGVRWRLLGAAGVGNGDVTRVVSLAVLTNWLGYAVVTGTLLLLSPMPGTARDASAAAAPELQAYAQSLKTWLAGPQARATGLLLLAIALAWLWVMSRRDLHNVHTHPHKHKHNHTHNHAPPGSRLQQRLDQAGLWPQARWLPAVQLAIGAANWLWMAAVMGCLLGLRSESPVPFGAVLGAQVIASLAGLVARVPGGLGVYEAVYLAMLGGTVPAAELLGALLVFRLLYFLVPLLLALPGYAWLTRHPRPSAPHSP